MSDEFVPKEVCDTLAETLRKCAIKIKGYLATIPDLNSKGRQEVEEALEEIKECCQKVKNNADPVTVQEYTDLDTLLDDFFELENILYEHVKA